MKRKMKWSTAVLTAGVIFMTACSKDKHNDKSGIFYGSQASLNSGTMKSFVELNSDGNPVSIGIKFTAVSLTGLPADPGKEWEYPLELPPEAKVTGYDHLVIDWNPHGHPPAAYMLPHFDFHYYRISKEEQGAVEAGTDITPVPTQYEPKDYQSQGMAVPNMGTHWVDTLAPELHGSTFTSTFIYGFYQGHLTFYEPMATLAWLNTKPTLDAPIKQPAAFEKSGYYPRVMHFSFDQTAGEYTMSLDGLLYHDAGK